MRSVHVKLAIGLALIVLACMTNAHSFQDQMVQERLQKESLTITGGVEISGKDSLNLICNFFKDWFYQLLQNMKKVYSPLVDALKNSNDILAAEELTYYISCESCELIAGTLIEALKDKNN